MRRYDPAMRTVKSAEARLAAMAERAQRAAELLRTRVDVERSAQNQKLLESMDRRADLQLRLQRTVEGLSVVAISYYAVNLAAYLALPADRARCTWPRALTGGAGPPIVMLVVWLMVRRIRKSHALTRRSWRKYPDGDRSRKSSAFRRSAPADARVQRVAQAVADVVHRQHRQRDRKARPDHPLGVELHVLHPVEQQPPPGREIGRKAKAQEATARIR